MTASDARAFFLAVALLLAGGVVGALLAGCTAPAWQTAGALADSTAILVARYQAWAHAERRRVLAQHPECGRDAACYDRALEPFEAAQAPVRACLAVAAPLLDGAAIAAEGRDEAGALEIVPRLAAQAAVCAETITRARRQTP